MKQKTIPETMAEGNPSNNLVAQKNLNQPAAGPSKATRKPRTFAAKNLDVSITVGIAGEDVARETFDKLASFIDKNSKMGIISFERGDTHPLLHIQCMISIKSYNTRMLKSQIKKVICWEDDGPLGGSICVRSLRDKGYLLHTIVRIIGYCLKDEKEEHFRLFQKKYHAKADGGRNTNGLHILSFGYQAQIATDPYKYLGESTSIPQERYCRFSHPTEMMLADMIHGRKFDNDGIEYHTDDEPTAEPNIKPRDMKPEPNISMQEPPNKQNDGADDDCDSTDPS
ncbi:hypothetical protein R1sor_007135 [Riccia sorocarpa]|uniref:Replitron HUH endonuclease domain-containing protein n=1 Tax=Riccia sorocarpa TaxID=122646 RepID=A0ABD3HVV9_9MARC